MKATWQWIEERQGYIYLILMFLVVVPAILIAVTQDTGIGKPTLEFLLGTWPAQKYSDDTIGSFKGGGWLYLGIVLRYWALFFIPAILALVIIWLLRKVRGLETVLLIDYLGHRDTFIRSEVFGRFVDVVNQAGMDDATFGAQLDEAYRQADKEWYDTQSEGYRRRIDEIRL